MQKKVAVFVGSLRKESYSRTLAQAFISAAPSSLTFEIIEIGQLPFYNEDLDNTTPPAEWTVFRNKIKSADALFFVTPEYNRSVPAVLKNALDVGSRPYGQNAWDGKPAAVASTSIGAIGGFGANHHLRQSMVFLNIPVMQQPEIYIGNLPTVFAEGKKLDEKVRTFFVSIMDAYAKWVERILK